MARIDKRKADPGILRNYLDVKHDRWFWSYYPFIMLGGMLGGVAIVGLMFVIQPAPMFAFLMVLTALVLVLVPYGALVFLARAEHRRELLLLVLGLPMLGIALMVLLSWLMPSGHF